MADRTRVVKGSSERRPSERSRRRVTKADGRFADYSGLRASSGIVVPEVKKVLLDRFKKADPSAHRHNIIYPSEMARSEWCPRATYYRMIGVIPKTEAAHFSMENIFAEGNAIHAKWQNWLADTGLLWGDWRCSRCSEHVKDSPFPDNDKEYGACVGTSFIDLTKGTVEARESYSHDWKYREVTLHSTSLPISGHADGALINHDVLIELKSVGLGTLRFEAPKLLEENTHEVNGKNIIDIEGLWKNLHRPLLAHVKQGNIYLWMAKEMGLPFDRIVFVYEFKANQRVKEFTVRASDDILDPMLHTAQIIETAVKNGVPPPCPFGGCGTCSAFEAALGK